MSATRVRWTCERCRRYVAGGTVTVVRGVPYGVCTDCGGQVRLRYGEPARAVARAAATAGQEASLLDVADLHREAFFGVVEDVPVGARVSVNDLRHDLDARGIPAKARGGLFHAAIAAGLLAPARTDGDVRGATAYTPSTGASAHAARVREYVRTASREAAS